MREEWIEPGVHVLINSPSAFATAHSTALIFFATPNGNTLEQTLGSAMPPVTDWHFDIQHIAAQTRRLRELMPDRNIVLACLQADSVSIVPRHCPVLACNAQARLRSVRVRKWHSVMFASPA